MCVQRVGRIYLEKDEVVCKTKRSKVRGYVQRVRRRKKKKRKKNFVSKKMKLCVKEKIESKTVCTKSEKKNLEKDEVVCTTKDRK